MAKLSTFITLLKILAIVFVVAVGVAGIIKRGENATSILSQFSKCINREFF